MDVNDFDSSEQSFDPERLDIEWAALNAIREALRIALKGQAVPTYQEALAVARIIGPQLFDPSSSLIASAQEAPAVREYRQRADAQSQLDGKPVTALEVVERDIAGYEQLLMVADKANDDKLQTKLRQMYGVRNQLVEPSYTENQLLIRDMFKAERVNLPVLPQHGDTFTEYRLPFDRGLRIRLLHPDHAEHLTGADLVYEMYDNLERTARVAFVQYKIWNGDVLYISDDRTQRQLQQLEERVCKSTFCDGDRDERSYRLPFCSAFIRPTDRLQSPDARLISRGLHVPLCAARRETTHSKRGGDVILRRDIVDHGVSQRIFEELFNRGMLGSRDLTYGEIEAFYKKHDIFRPTDHLVVHVQDVWLSHQE